VHIAILIVAFILCNKVDAPRCEVYNEITENGQTIRERVSQGRWVNPTPQCVILECPPIYSISSEASMIKRYTADKTSHMFRNNEKSEGAIAIMTCPDE
jgi:hypothetical protein